MRSFENLLSSTYGVKIVNSEAALVPAVELWDNVKEFCSKEFKDQFYEWSLATFGRVPGMYYVETPIVGNGERVLLAHPLVLDKLKKKMEQRIRDD